MVNLTKAQREFLLLLDRHAGAPVSRSVLPPADRKQDKVRQSFKRLGLAEFVGGCGWRDTMSISNEPRQTRIRASESAIRAALKALQDAGLAVDKVCVTGAQIEIHCGYVERGHSDEKDGGLEEW